jgi:predicted nucleotidyltransferase
MTQIERLLRVLDEAGIEFIVVGGIAATIHGSARLTQDLDLVYRRTPENLERLASALQPFAPYLRGAPPGLPFLWDAETLRRGLNFTLSTTLGALDLLGEIAGGGAYEDLLADSHRVEAFGIGFLCLGLSRLIQVKRAAGRPKDLEAISELEAMLAERESRPPGGEH